MAWNGDVFIIRDAASERPAVGCIAWLDLCAASSWVSNERPHVGQELNHGRYLKEQTISKQDKQKPRPAARAASTQVPVEITRGTNDDDNQCNTLNSRMRGGEYGDERGRYADPGEDGCSADVLVEVIANRHEESLGLTRKR